MLLVWLAFPAGACAQAKQFSRVFTGRIITKERTEPVLKEARRSVVVVEQLNDRGKVVGFGTGVYVSSNQVATCLHVIESATNLRIVNENGKRYAVAGVFGADHTMGAVVLWVTNAPASIALPIREAPARIAELYVAVFL